MSEVKTSINDGYKSPGLSLVVVIYNMRREAPRTLFSLSEKYQQNISQEDYEVIVIDNGSGDPFTVAEIKRYGDNFRYYHISNACPSPARAMNFGAEQARGKYLGLMVDGARIASPNLLSRAVQGLSLLPDPLVSSLAFHLGKDVQNISVKQGYDKQSEDQLLENSGWKSDGYNLFKISTLAGSSSNGYLGILPESNSLFLKNETFRKVKGYDERFLLPGGGLVNLEFYSRLLNLQETVEIMILGEGTFHQVHGGAATNNGYCENYFKVASEEYEKLIGTRYVLSLTIKKRHYIGEVREKTLPVWLLSQRKFLAPQA